MSTQLALWTERGAGDGTAPKTARGGEAAAVSACDIRRALVVVQGPTAGLRTQLLTTYSLAARAGWRFTFVGPADGSLDALRDLGRALPRTETIVAPVKGGTCRLWPTVRSLLRDGGFDLIHSHGLTAAAHAVAANYGFGVPHIAALHDPLHGDKAPGLFRRWMLGWMMRRPDAVTVADADARVDLIQRFPPLRRGAERIVILPNGVRIRSGESSGAGLLRRRLCLDANTTLIGCVGGAEPDAVLLDALQRIAADATTPHFHLIAFGTGDLHRRDLERRGLSGRVTLLNLPADLSAAFRQVDLVVVPSAAEDGAHTAMEAMTAGVPVIGADAPGLREAFRGTPSRTVAAGDADALRFGLQIALSQPWTEAARAFASAARARFDCIHSARRLLELFDRLTGSGPAVKHPQSGDGPVRQAA